MIVILLRPTNVVRDSLVADRSHLPFFSPSAVIQKYIARILDRGRRDELLLLLDDDDEDDSAPVYISSYVLASTGTCRRSSRRLYTSVCLLTTTSSATTDLSRWNVSSTTDLSETFCDGTAINLDLSRVGTQPMQPI
jgi:hypothetical protein